jgi:single-stranded-DNA-specific exonuclease
MTVVATNRELRRREFWTAPRVEPDLLALLDLVALGTVADVVSLKGLNRAFVAKGLLAMRRREGSGLNALMDAARMVGPPEPWHLGFLLGPRINAGGRIGRADLGARLLMADDPTEAMQIASQLDRLNRERQVIEQAQVAEAEAEALASLGAHDNAAVIVTAAQGWHPGVVGLIAARLRERFGRPAFAIALEAGGVGTGSGRSILGADLGRAVRQAVAQGILMKGGGHPMAAGVTLRREALASFRAFLHEQLAAAVTQAREEDALLVDGALTAGGATLELMAMIARAGPFGPGNAEPVFALPAHTVVYAEQAGENHVRARLRSSDGAVISAVAFRAAGQALGDALFRSRGERIHAAGTIKIDRWQGFDRVQLQILDVAADAPAATAPSGF